MSRNTGDFTLLSIPSHQGRGEHHDQIYPVACCGEVHSKANFRAMAKKRATLSLKVAKESSLSRDLGLKQDKEFGSLVFFARFAALRETTCSYT